MAVQEVAGARLLHDLGPRVAGELAEAIGTVHDGKDFGDLGVAEDKVGVCLGWFG